MLEVIFSEELVLISSQGQAGMFDANGVSNAPAIPGYLLPAFLPTHPSRLARIYSVQLPFKRCH